MILEAEKHSYNDLVTSILNLDQGILSCIIVSSPEGSTLARAATSEFLSSFGNLPETTEGMAAHWALLAFNAMKRLDTVRSPTKYIVVGRDKFKTLIFPIRLNGGSTPMAILIVRSRTEITDIYEKTMKVAASK